MAAARSESEVQDVAKRGSEAVVEDGGEPRGTRPDGRGTTSAATSAATSDAAVGWPGVAPPPWAPAAKGRGARAEKPALSREAIVGAALRIIDAEGIDAVSMRRVALEFETGAASLYAYVANKDELFDLVVDAVMAEIAQSMPGPEAQGDWREGLKETTRQGIRVLRSHRDVAKAFLGRIPFGPNGLRAVEAQLGILRAGGVPDRVAAYAGDLLGSYMVAAVIEEDMWRSRFPGATEADIARQMGEIRGYLESLPADRFPNLVALAAQLMAGDTDGFDRFELGLEIIVRGIGSFVQTAAELAQ